MPTRTSTIEKTPPQPVRIERADPGKPILFTAGRTWLGIHAGTLIEVDGVARSFDADTPVALADLVPGRDYGVGIDGDGRPFAALADGSDPLADGWIGGFHFAPGDCAEGVSGGDAVPAINPHSLWDVGFRPACPDPRGMALVETGAGKRVWVDIYMLGTAHHEQGTSRCGATIATGRNLPVRPDGKGKVEKLDYHTAVDIYASHGKRLLGAEEFFAAAYGVKERCSRDNRPTRTGEMEDGGARFIGKWGMFDATGTVWQWGTDGHPDDPRPSIFGGSWLSGGDAGSRHASLDCWPGVSDGNISARGACDPLAPA